MRLVQEICHRIGQENASKSVMCARNIGGEQDQLNNIASVNSFILEDSSKILTPHLYLLPKIVLKLMRFS